MLVIKMPYACVVLGCSNRTNRETDKRFFRVPREVIKKGERAKDFTRRRREKWLSNLSLRSKGAQSKNARVCSDHFVKGCPSNLYKDDDVDWAPTLNLGHEKVKKQSEVQLGSIVSISSPPQTAVPPQLPPQQPPGSSWLIASQAAGSQSPADREHQCSQELIIIEKQQLQLLRDLHDQRERHHQEQMGLKRAKLDLLSRQLELRSEFTGVQTLLLF
ncbi:uncharacterized protein LOC132874954 [Neoarius graeffei]|uniref:uncharacterized protein LOC132874954 n=1 Tax=Neoarius graeffei TaxID=443677 RepID=UPI00298BCBC9|nr:uncharacterized protein LOC132874954 [Neoarius graeffei]